MVFVPFKRLCYLACYGDPIRPTLNKFAYCHVTFKQLEASVLFSMFTRGCSYNSTIQHLHKCYYSIGTLHTKTSIAFG